MRKVYYLIISFSIFSCFDIPGPNVGKSGLLLTSLYFSQSGCRFDVQNNLNESKSICLNSPLSECSLNGLVNSNISKISKLKTGLKDIAKKYDRCVIDVYDLLNYLESLAEEKNIILWRYGYVIKESAIIVDVNCSSSSNNSGLISPLEYSLVFDPSIYTAIYAQNSDCSLQIPLSESERTLVNDIKSGRKLLFL